MPSIISLLLFICFAERMLVGAPEVKDRLVQEDRVILLDAHNSLRSMANLKPQASNVRKMYWDKDLEYIGKKLADTCVFEHSFPGIDDTKFKGKPVGQNLYYISGAGLNLSASVKSWYNEVKDYTYETTACAPSKACGHYTQIAWATTIYLGCSINACPQRNILVCNYYPAGNYVGEKIFKAGDACTGCPPEATLCDTNATLVLCDTQTKCSAVTECSSPEPLHCLCDASFYDKVYSGAEAALIKSPLVIYVNTLLVLLALISLPINAI